MLPVLLTFVSMAMAGPEGAYIPKDGDIILHTSQSNQSRLIQAVTGSPYSHVGVVYVQDGTPMVFEAVATVRLTPLDQWVARGAGADYRVLRTSESLTSAQLQSMQAVGEGFRGKRYDLPFQWSDDTMYCSELV